MTPIAVLNDVVVGALVFFLVTAFVTAHTSIRGISVPIILFLIFLLVRLAVSTRFIGGKMIQYTYTSQQHPRSYGTHVAFLCGVRILPNLPPAHHLFQRLWLVYLQPLREPAILLSG